MNNEIKIKVGGKKFWLSRDDLRRHPTGRIHEFDIDNKACSLKFNVQDALIFEHIIRPWYRTGRLEYLSWINRSLVEHELEYWGVTSTGIPTAPLG